MRRITALICLVGLALTGCGGGRRGAERVVSTPQSPAPVASVAPTAAPSPSAAPSPVAAYVFGTPAEAREAVGEDYFADACFVGDSRLEGFSLYSGIGAGTFLTHTGLKVFELERREISWEGEDLLVKDAVARGQYGKVYVCLGVNDLGYENDQGFFDHYAQLIDDIRASQPDALLYIMRLLPVNSRRCAEKEQASYVTNEKIGAYNALLDRLAEEKRVILLDPGEEIVDETGELPYDMTGDGVHLNKAGYQLWYTYLTTHTVTGEELG